MQVDAYVEAAVVPIGLVIPAPLPVAFHLGDVAAHLTALVPEATGIAVDFGATRLQPATAVAPPVTIGASRAADGKRHASGECRGENQTGPCSIVLHRASRAARISGAGSRPLL